MTVQKVFIAGSGLMGSGIAQVCAQSGMRVSLCDVREEALSKARSSIEWSVRKLAEKGKLGDPPQEVLGRIDTGTDFGRAADAELAIEAVFEDVQVKLRIFETLDRTCPSHALLASNTSAIPITELAAATGRPGQVLGLHFFSPVPMMEAVEVIRGAATTEDTMASGIAFVRSIGKEPIRVNRDVAGFVINRLNLPSSMEAMRLVEEGIATPEDIDKGVKLALGRKMGIFETGDMVGLDVTYGALLAMYEESKDPRWYPPMILRRKVKAGHLGRKSGMGWYAYDAQGARKDV